MAELRDVIQRLKLGHGVRDIHRSTGVHRTIVRQLRDVALELGWLEADCQLPSEQQIEQARHRVEQESEAGKSLFERLAAHEEDFQRWHKQEYTAVVMHDLIRDRVPCSLSTIDRSLRSRFPTPVQTVSRRDTVAGKVMEVDFGYLGITYDPHSRRNRRTWVFSGRLRHSRRAWRERCFEQKQPTFFLCHIHALEFFGGVVERLVPDNLKAAVVKASFQDPIVNRAYRALAEHYGFLIDPCPPYRANLKGGVESDIKYLKGRFWPIFREQQRQRGHEIPYADELEQELERWGREVADKRLVGGVGRTPEEIFATEEAAALQPLPSSRWDPLSWGEPTVGPDWRVQFEKGFYSVPYGYIGHKVLVYADRSRVRIYAGTCEIALHARVPQPWGKSIKEEHAPPHTQEWLSIDRSGLLKWAHRLGEPVGELAAAILADKAVDGMRPVRALIRLADTYSVGRLAVACRRALLYETTSYRSVKEILRQNLDRLPLSQPAEPDGQIAFRFQREQGYFDPARHVG
jgi:transposase